MRHRWQPSRPARLPIRYTAKTVKPLPLILATVLLAGSALAEETSFRNVQLPDDKGKTHKAVLIFSDNDKAVEVRPAKGQAVAVPYAQIDKCAYEYTTEIMDAKAHWLEIDYHDGDARKILVVRMEGKNYLQILDAVKAHTGLDVELLGNANKRRGEVWHN